MESINFITKICVDNGYINQEQAPWLSYGIERRLTSFLIAIPMLIVGSLISSPIMAISFYVSFFMLRSRTNGIHAKTLGGCFVLSLLTEVFFLGILTYVWNAIVATILLVASAISIFALAPYNHPNMDFSSKEMVECARSAKRRLAALILLLIILYVMQFNEIATGISLGIVMVAVTLTFAYIRKGER